MPDTTSTRLLILESVAADAMREVRTLREAGHAVLVRRVSEGAGLAQDLAQFRPDLVIVAGTVPNTDVIAAVRLVHDHDAALPILLVTSAPDDAAALEVVKAGATDYVRKDHLGRLPVAFVNAMATAQAERARRDAMQALRQHRSDLEDLYNNAPCGYHSADRDLTILAINDTELAWLGYRRDEVVGRLRVTDLLTPESAAHMLHHAFPRFLATGEAQDLELDFCRKDGSTFPVRLQATSIIGADGTHVASRTIVSDISRIKAAEQRERLSAEMLRNALYSLDIAMLVLDPQLDIRFLSPAAEARFGIRAGDAGEVLLRKLLGRGAADAAYGSAGEELRAEAASVLHSGIPIETDMLAEGGAWYTRRLAPYRTLSGKTEGIVITLSDRSAHKRTADHLAAALRAAEVETEKLRAVLDAIDAAIIVADRDGHITQFNAAAQRMHGSVAASWRMYDFTPEDWRTRKPGMVATRHEDWASGGGLCKFDGQTPLPHDLNPMVRALRGETTPETLLVLKRPDGSGVPITAIGTPLRAADGTPAGALVVLTDATEQVRTTTLLRRAAMEARRVLEANPHPVLVLNPEGRITDLTAPAERATGLARHRLIGSDFAACFTDPEAARAVLRDTLAQGAVRDRALVFQDVAGGGMPVLMDAATVRDDAGAIAGVAAYARDNTERVMAERHAELQADFAATVRQLRAART